VCVWAWASVLSTAREIPKSATLTCPVAFRVVRGLVRRLRFSMELEFSFGHSRLGCGQACLVVMMCRAVILRHGVREGKEEGHAHCSGLNQI